MGKRKKKFNNLSLIDSKHFNLSAKKNSQNKLELPVLNKHTFYHSFSYNVITKTHSNFDLFLRSNRVALLKFITDPTLLRLQFNTLRMSSGS